MKKVLFLIAQKDFQDVEFGEPKRILESGGFSVSVASETTQEAEGMFGLRVVPDISFSEAFRCVEDFRAVVVIGGSGSTSLVNNSYVSRILRQAYNKGLIMAAICYGPVVLAKAGVLTGRRVTVFPSAVEKVRHEGAIPQDRGVVEDGRFITAAGPQFASDFGKTLLKKLRS